MITVSEEEFDPGTELSAFRSVAATSGGVAAFAGYVRGEGDAVKALVLEHYPGPTESSIAAIIAHACDRWALDAVRIRHRVGRMTPGEAIVFAAAAAAHRRDALEAVDFLMDFLKTEALFWKKEERQGGAVWIEPRARDYADAARWRRDGADHGRH